MECPLCGRETQHSGGSAGLVRDYCLACGWEQWAAADPALPSTGPVHEYEYALHWASAAGPTAAELAALRRIVPGLEVTSLGALRAEVSGRGSWDLGDARGLDLERIREAAGRAGLRLERRPKNAS